MGIFNTILGKRQPVVPGGTVVSLPDSGSKPQDSGERRRAAILDALGTCVMMVGPARNIVSMNPAARKMLQEAEPDIRRQVHGFAVERLPGSSLDQLFVLAPLQAGGPAWSGRVCIGTRTFDIKATPMAGDAGQDSGCVLEWHDKTSELAFEKLVQQAVKHAVQGRLDERIDTSKHEGFLGNLAGSINQLLAVFGQVIGEAGSAVGALAEGKLTRKVETDFHGSYGALKQDINSTIDRLLEVVTQISEGAGNVKLGAAEIASGNANLSQRTEEQAASLEETSAAMEQITTTVQQNAANARQAHELACTARQSAEAGGAVVGKAVAAMRAISDSSHRITEIIGVIDEIAFQTNLLALNAAVEAARAGDQGRGFAVVASEVRNLAGRSATAAKEIKSLIRDSSDKVREGEQLVNKSGETLGDIVAAVKKVNDIVAEISTASEEQASGLEQINRAVGDMDGMTQQNAALVEQAAAASEALGAQAEMLDRLIAFFDPGTRGSPLRVMALSQSARQPPGPAVVAGSAGKTVLRHKRAQAGGHKQREEQEWTAF